jgi:hypothetical protein
MNKCLERVDDRHIFGILESSATQLDQDVDPTHEFFFHRPIYSLCMNLGRNHCLALDS